MVPERTDTPERVKLVLRCSAELDAANPSSERVTRYARPSAPSAPETGPLAASGRLSSPACERRSVCGAGVSAGRLPGKLWDAAAPPASASVAASSTCHEPSMLTRDHTAPSCDRGGSARHASCVLWVAAGRVPAPYAYRVVLIGAGHPTNFQGDARLDELRGRGDRDSCGTGTSTRSDRTRRPCGCET